MALPRADNIVIRLFLLHHTPRGLHVLFGVAPVAPRVKIAEEYLFLKPRFDAGNAASNLACYKSLSAPWTLMVEENSVDCKNTIGIAIESCGVVGKNFRASVGTLRIKGRPKPLRRRSSAEHLAGARLVECNRLLFVFLIVRDWLTDAQRAERCAVCGVLGNIK